MDAFANIKLESKNLFPSITNGSSVQPSIIFLHPLFKRNFIAGLIILLAWLILPFFTNKIALLADEEGHHPRIVTEWGRVRLTWWTHKIRNLHRNDFLMAVKSSDIFESL